LDHWILVREPKEYGSKQGIICPIDAVVAFFRTL
jgi:hypothetical protein